MDETRTARLVGFSDEDDVQSLGFCETPDSEGWVLIIQRGQDGERCLCDQDGRTTYAPFTADHGNGQVTFGLSREAAGDLGCGETLTLLLDCPPDHHALVSEHLHLLLED